MHIDGESLSEATHYLFEWQTIRFEEKDTQEEGEVHKKCWFGFQDTT